MRISEDTIINQMKLYPRVVTYRRYGYLKNYRSERLDKSTSTEKSNASSVNSPRSLMESKVVLTEEEDSDCLFIAETAEEGNSPEGNKGEESESASLESEHLITPNPTFHKLPIAELKKKLAFCSLCSVQYLNHKQANLCLAKHGKRQCWLCLGVIPNTKDAYLQHCVRVHKIEQNNDIVSCPYCKKNFDFRQGFNQHIVKVHFSEDTSYVTNTASLSPNSLVTLYTGQPRLTQFSELSPSVKNPENSRPNLTTGNNSGGDIYRGNDGGHYTAVSTTSSLTISPVLLSSFFRDKFPVIPETLLGAEKGKLNYHHHQQQPSFGLEVDKEQGIVKDRGGETRERESVIRETPQPNNMTFNEMYGFPQQQHPFLNHNQPSFIEELGAGNEAPGYYYPEGFALPQNPGYSSAENYQSQTHNFQASAMEQYSLGTYGTDPRISASRGSRYHMPILRHKGYYHPQQRQTQTPDPNSPNNNEQNSIPPRMTPGPQHIINYHNYSGHRGLDSSRMNHYYRQEYPPVDRGNLLPTSPSLMEMERLVHSAPNQTNQQFTNSVNTMLKTVAKFSSVPTPNNTAAAAYSPEHVLLSPEPTGVPSESQSPYTATYLSPCRGPLALSPLDSSDASPFKVPTHAGIKRRILNKWDEHQETKRMETNPQSPHIVPAPTTPEMDSSQVEIHTGVNPSSAEQPFPESAAYYGTTKTLFSDKPFWHKMINEHENAHKKGSSIAAADMSIHKSSKKRSTTPNSHPSNTPPNFNPQLPLLTHYMKQDVGGDRHYSIPPQQPHFHPQYSHKQNFYPDLSETGGRASSAPILEQQPPRLLTASGVDQTDMANNHLQYQHRIVRQATSETYDQIQEYNAMQMTQPQSPHKRKSSVPTRVIPNRTGESVVVQNPFEEEESNSSHKKRSHPTSSHNNHYQKVPPLLNIPSYNLSPSTGNTFSPVQLKKLKEYSKQMLANGEAHFLSCRPNFTSGGHFSVCNEKFTAVPSPISAQQHEAVLNGQSSTWSRPFLVAPRYTESTQKIVDKLSELNNDRKLEGARQQEMRKGP